MQDRKRRMIALREAVVHRIIGRKEHGPDISSAANGKFTKGKVLFIDWAAGNPSCLESLYNLL